MTMTWRKLAIVAPAVLLTLTAAGAQAPPARAVASETQAKTPPPALPPVPLEHPSLTRPRTIAGARSGPATASSATGRRHEAPRRAPTSSGRKP
jgi:hypothetical protein